MKIIIFGSTGTIGKQVVEQALNADHQVTAFARNPNKLDFDHANQRVIKGDVLNPENVENAMKGHDAVICTLGMPLMNKEFLREKGTLNIVNAMTRQKIERLSCLSVFGAGDSWQDLPASYKYLIVPLLFRRVIADHELQESHIKNSNLDWVITRATNFTSKKYTGVYSHGFRKANRPPKMKINQLELAQFLLRQLSDDTYIHQTPAISR